MQGKTLGGYRIESELGSGGMGTVWLAVDAEDHRYAIKVIHSHLLGSPGFFKRFLREAEIGQAVRHPNVVRCYDADALLVDGEQQNFLVMEYVEGQTLRDLLEELGRVPEELCRHIGREVAKGLTAIHEAGVVHRDLKPENVLITPDHEIKIMDLGVARLADEAIRLSQTGAFVGSIHYAAPEQFKEGGEDLDGRADLHALGLILYELSSGTHPYFASAVTQVLRRILNEQPRRLGEVNPQLSAFFEEVTHTLLAKDRAERFAAASDLVEVLTSGESSTWWRGRALTLRAETKRPLRRIRIPRETAVYGRESELDRLTARYDRAASGEGQVVLIEGEAGIGKTRLVDELIGRLRHAGEDLNFLFGSYPPGGAATAAGAWSTAYREQFGAEGLEATLEGYLTVTPVLIPAFAALLRGEPPPAGKATLTKDSIQTVFVHATRALAAERATVVLIEDLHFAPEEGRSLFASLALAVPEQRILLIGTARPGIPEKWRANVERLEPASRLDLQRLGPKDLAHLLKDAFRSERLAHELGMKIAEKSDGNPFFAFEIIRGLREGKFISRTPDGTWISTQVIEEIEIPSSVQDLIQARIADLDEEEQELLDIAACCGFEFDPGLVAEAVGHGLIPSLRRFGHLEKAHRLIRSAGRQFVFDHNQVQETLYAGIAEQLREEYHAAIGKALETRHPEPAGVAAVEVSEHYFLGGRGSAALPHLEVALDHLETSYLNDRAIALTDRALEARGLLAGSDRMDVLLRKAGRLDLLGRRAEERTVLDEAIDLADESGHPLQRARARIHLGRHLMAVSRYELSTETVLGAIELAKEADDERAEAEATTILGTNSLNLSRHEVAKQEYGRALSLFRKIGDRRGETRVMGSLGLVLIRLGRSEEAREPLERTLALSRELGDRQMEAITLSNLASVADFSGRKEEARELEERGLVLCREIGDRRREARAIGSRGFTFMGLGSYEDAREQFERSLSLSRETADRTGEASATCGLGNALFVLGRFEEAIEIYDRVIDLYRDLGDRQGETATIGNLGNVLASLGRYEEARKHHQASLELSRDLGDRKSEAISTGNLALANMSLGRLEEASHGFDRYLTTSREIGFRHGEVIAMDNLGILHVMFGDFPKAREHLERCLDLSQETDDRRAEGYALHGLAWLAQTEGDRDTAIRLFGKALDSRREIAFQQGVAETLAPFGGLLAGMDRDDDAGRHLEEAVTLGRELGMPWPIVLANCHLANLASGDTATAIATFDEFGSRLAEHQKVEVRFLLFKATNDPAHLEEAHRLLADLVDHAPEEYRQTMIENVPLHRDVMATWEEHGG